jgi:hypothetical protein
LLAVVKNHSDGFLDRVERAKFSRFQVAIFETSHNLTRAGQVELATEGGIAISNFALVIERD